MCHIMLHIYIYIYIYIHTYLLDLYHIQNTLPCTVMYYYVSSYLTVHFCNHYHMHDMHRLDFCAWQFVFASTALFGESLCCQQWADLEVPSWLVAASIVSCVWLRTWPSLKLHIIVRNCSKQDCTNSSTIHTDQMY